MSKQPKATVTAEVTSPSSLKDAGYRFALSGDTSESIARYVLGQCPGIVDGELSDTVKADLTAGFQLRKHEIEGESFFKLTDGVYVPVADPKDSKGLTAMSINVAMSYSQQEFGKLKERDRGLYDIISPLRKKMQTYASNRFADLKTAARRIANEGKPRERAANKDFTNALTVAFDALEKRAKTSKARGDVTADPAKFLTARDAFLKIYNG